MEALAQKELNLDLQSYMYGDASFLTADLQRTEAEIKCPHCGKWWSKLNAKKKNRKKCVKFEGGCDKFFGSKSGSKAKVIVNKEEPKCAANSRQNALETPYSIFFDSSGQQEFGWVVSEQPFTRGKSYWVDEPRPSSSIQKPQQNNKCTSHHVSKPMSSP